MTTILSTPTSMTVGAPGTSALARLAASMAPGTWAQLVVPNQDSALADNGASGSPLGYSNAMPWNPITKCIEIVGGDHHGATPAMRHIRYDDASSAFYEVQSRPVVSGIGHGYDHSSVNPATGDLYHRLYGSTNTAVKRLGASTFDQSSIPAWSAGYVQVAVGTCWWSGSFTGGRGAGPQGALVIFNSGSTGSSNSATDGAITAYDPLTRTWIYTATSMAPNSYQGSGGAAGATYHSIMEYSSTHNCAVYGGGNAAPFQIHRLNSNGSATSLPNVPSNAGMGMNRGILCNEPVTGNFLLLSGRSLWALNPTGPGTWTLQTGSRVPPSGVGDPANTALVICCSIPEYGVVAYLTQPSTTGGTFYLYKHA